MIKVNLPLQVVRQYDVVDWRERPIKALVELGQAAKGLDGHA